MRLQPRGQAAQAGFKPGDVLIEYDGKAIQSRDDLQSARVDAAGKESVRVMIRRGESELGFKLKPGPLGFVPGTGYDEPVFR